MTVPVAGLGVEGDLAVPPGASGVVLFAHGSGSSRHSPRNRMVAEALNEAGLATLLFDLLSDAEAADRANVFDIELLAERLIAAARRARDESRLKGLRAGYFGASTGAAAALVAAAREPAAVSAVVSRGGRPDLAGPLLAQVRAPTLLIVGGDDFPVVRLNEDALETLDCPKRLEIVPGATHLFEEPGALERVAALSADWFVRHLGEGAEARP